MRNRTTGNGFFRKISLVTLVAVYFLILVGGVVRSTGAGMGCPDWPKCFGKWIPPTSEEKLPSGYQQQYVDQRHNKNMKFAGYLDMIGFNQQAQILRSDEAIRQETSFNPVKTWTEYLNRVVGVIIGLLIIINLIASAKYIRSETPVFIWAVVLFLLVVFQGWIGSIVVSTHLIPWTVTLHMLLAVLIISILIYLVFRSRRKEVYFQPLTRTRYLNVLLIISGILILGQVLLGTQVREEVDMVSLGMNYADRTSWIASLGKGFYIHRSFSLVIVAFQIGILIYLYREREQAEGTWIFARLLFSLILLEIVFGVIMAYFGIPPFIQPLHLLTGILIFGVQFLILLIVNNRSIVQTKEKALA